VSARRRDRAGDQQAVRRQEHGQPIDELHLAAEHGEPQGASRGQGPAVVASAAGVVPGQQHEREPRDGRGGGRIAEQVVGGLAGDPEQRRRRRAGAGQAEPAGEGVGEQAGAQRRAEGAQRHCQVRIADQEGPVEGREEVDVHAGGGRVAEQDPRRPERERSKAQLREQARHQGVVLVQGVVGDREASLGHQSMEAPADRRDDHEQREAVPGRSGHRAPGAHAA
jgi:hypothetical protein